MNYTSVGLWDRGIAWITDHLIVLILTWPLFLLIYGLSKENTSLQMINTFVFIFFSILYTLLSWSFKQTTLGKLAFRAQIIDHQSGHPPTLKQYIIRYFGQWVSLSCLGLGILWILFDEHKRSWHDRWAGTRVVVLKHTLQDK